MILFLFWRKIFIYSIIKYHKKVVECKCLNINYQYGNIKVRCGQRNVTFTLNAGGYSCDVTHGSDISTIASPIKV